MSRLNPFATSLLIAAIMLAITVSDVSAQLVVGGPDGVILGGGQGLRIGGINGVQFGGGWGARFGPPGVGVQFGGGEGARFGPSPYGVQFGGGRIPANPYAPMNANNVSIAESGRKVLRLSEQANRPFEYSLNGTPFRLMPGREVDLQRNQRWVVSFSPGPQYPEKSLAIEQPGRYVFVETESGWDLVAESGDVNSAEPNMAPGPIGDPNPRLEPPLPAESPSQTVVESGSVIDANKTLPPPRPANRPAQREFPRSSPATNRQQPGQPWSPNNRIRAARPSERQSPPPQTQTRVRLKSDSIPSVLEKK